MVGIQGSDIVDGTKTLVLGLVWQLMRWVMSIFFDFFFRRSEELTGPRSVLDWVSIRLWHPYRKTDGACLMSTWWNGPTIPSRREERLHRWSRSRIHPWVPESSSWTCWMASSPDMSTILWWPSEGMRKRRSRMVCVAFAHEYGYLWLLPCSQIGNLHRKETERIDFPRTWRWVIGLKAIFAKRSSRDI